MPGRQQTLAALREDGAVAVIRAEDPGSLISVARALHKGGLRFVEITMTVPGAIEVIRDATSELAAIDVYIGAGTVLDAETARLAILAGACYVVGPTYEQNVIDMCHSYGVAAVPAGLTPTEILAAWRGGADVVKVFPANSVGGPDYFKAVRAPLPSLDLLPSGGVDLESAPAYIKAGAIAVAVGGAVAGKTLIAEGKFDTITENAKRMISVVREARQQK
jgi:2-dehydro-3-deoxyphosphogluconate aldolase/(4S)-4-hydroxy-2-oxoglutarate aldolase